MPVAGKGRTRRSGDRRMEADRRNLIGLDWISKDDTSTQKEGDAKDSVQVYRLQTVLLILIASYKGQTCANEREQEENKRKRRKAKTMTSCPCSMIDEREWLKMNEGG